MFGLLKFLGLLILVLIAVLIIIGLGCLIALLVRALIECINDDIDW